MTTLERLHEWKQAGILTGVQHATLTALVRKERFSLFLELNALLYLGVVSLVGGLGWTFRTYFTNIGDPAILTTLSLLCAGCLYYCFTRAEPYSRGEIEHPGLALSYVLYLGCLAFSTELGYIEFRFHLLQGAWDSYLLFTAAAFALLAYRFDNRFVLSLALASLAGWFGVRVSALALMSPAALRMSALAYGIVVAGAGTTLYRLRIKPHFLEAYLHVAANVVFAAVLSGLFDTPTRDVYLVGLIALSAAAIGLGIRFNRFAFVAYGTVYGYAGVTIRMLGLITGETARLAYVVVTGTLVIGLLVLLARRFGRSE
jgi:hypothetical protein